MMSQVVPKRPDLHLSYHTHTNLKGSFTVRGSNKGNRIEEIKYKWIKRKTKVKPPKTNKGAKETLPLQRK